MGHPVDKPFGNGAFPIADILKSIDFCGNFKKKTNVIMRNRIEIF